MSTAVQPVTAQFVPTESQLAVAYSVCRGITRTAAKNFYYAFLALPTAKRQALCAVYAFMRRCDDIADDEGLPAQVRRQKLAEWLAAVHLAQAGHPTDDPILLALTDSQRRYEIPGELLNQLAYGTAMDLVDTSAEDGAQTATGPSGLRVQYKTFEDLRLYCYRVASVVGLVCIRIFGYKDAAAEPLAEKCGLAFQLTNIIRDVKEDAAVGRVYLPAEDLAAFGISTEELLQTPNAARIAPLLAMEADRARECYAAGEKLIELIDEDSQPALWVLITIYRQLLEKIALRQYDVFGEKVRLTTWEKLKVLGKGFLKRLS
ncbi:MAG: phytoene/squalene synthase family protein [Acidobacteria bacterium]|nr:phytoene/squalene synthase family protein [Acidobacteriota bacterium]